ncbi:hypothetical protein MRX96_024270 [Rhipicephalus microplus]
MFLVLWRGQRFAAVRAMTCDELIVTAALFASLRGESVELLFGDHTDLECAFLAGRVVTDYNANVFGSGHLGSPRVCSCRSQRVIAVWLRTAKVRIIMFFVLE